MKPLKRNLCGLLIILAGFPKHNFHIFAHRISFLLIQPRLFRYISSYFSAYKIINSAKPQSQPQIPKKQEMLLGNYPSALTSNQT